MPYGFLASDRRQHFRGPVQSHVETPLEPRGHRLPIGRHARTQRILVVGGFKRRPLQGANQQRRGRTIGIAHSQVHKINPRRQGLFLFFIDLDEQVGRQGPQRARSSEFQAFLRVKSQTTRLVKEPTSCMRTSTSSPIVKGPMPDGVPVKMTSPGFRVMIWATKLTNCTGEKTSWLVRELCLRAPFTRHSMARSAASSPCIKEGPSGQKVSKPLALVHWPSFFCRSLAVTSLAQVNPKRASSLSTPGPMVLPMTKANSAS